jgi:hypothetical protein
LRDKYPHINIRSRLVKYAEKHKWTRNYT